MLSSHSQKGLLEILKGKSNKVLFGNYLVFGETFKDEGGVLGMHNNSQIESSDEISPCIEYYLIVMLSFCERKIGVLNKEIE